MLYPELTPESHASSSFDSLQEKSEGLPIPYDLPPNVMDTNSEPARSVERFAAWAMAETDATTIGEAISYVVNGDVEVEEWRDFAQVELQHFSEAPQHPYAIIDDWVDQLPARDRRIFNYRIADMGGGLTLQELADDFGITRERVRQLGSRLHGKFSEFVETPDGLPVRWRMHSLRRRIGVAIPASDLDPMLTTDDGDTRYGSLLLRFAGPYERDNEWHMLSSEVGRDPTAAIKGTADEYGRIDRDHASTLLSKWGLERSLHEGWLTRDGSIRSINGQLVRWKGSISDRLTFALADIGKPATVKALMDHISEERTRNSAVNALSADPRIVRASRLEWALASWGRPVYLGIAQSIRQLLEKHGKPMRVKEVVDRMNEDFGIVEASTRAYCNAAMFVTENGRMRLRRDEEPYSYARHSPGNSPGVFCLGPRRVSLLIEVDRNVLRGSGRNLPSAVGYWLNVAVKDHLVFAGPESHTVTITFPESSFLGPSLGSTRSAAEHVGARIGDYMTMIFDRSDMSVEARATPKNHFEPSWDLVARLSGIQPETKLSGLAESMGCESLEVVERLTKRKDEIILNALPPHVAGTGTESRHP